MEITFDLPHVFHPEASQVENAIVLEQCLEFLIAVNMSYLKSHSVPTLYQSGVRYFKTREWLSIPALYYSKLGDCKSLTCALCAEYRLADIECRPVFRWLIRTNGSRIPDYHILVQVGSGFEDPSKRLGMPIGEVNKFYRG